MACEYDRPCGGHDCDRCHPENYVAVECVECGVEGPRYAMHECEACGGWLCGAEGDLCGECRDESPNCGAELPVDIKRKLRAFARLCIINSGGDPDAPNGKAQFREERA